MCDDALVNVRAIMCNVVLCVDGVLWCVMTAGECDGGIVYVYVC